MIADKVICESPLIKMRRVDAFDKSFLCDNKRRASASGCRDLREINRRKIVRGSTERATERFARPITDFFAPGADRFSGVPSLSLSLSPCDVGEPLRADS